jgi:hypothetical protein
MNISGSDAAAALGVIERTERRTHEAAGYAVASPHLILWGLIWIAGYIASGLLPVGQWGLAWIPLDVFGIGGSIYLGVRAAAYRRPGSATSRTGARASLAALAIGAFILSLYVVYGVPRPDTILILPALVMGLVYTLVGLFTLQRFAWIGFAIFIASMAGYFLAHPILPYWLAAVGGGGLLLAGLWLRRI